MRKLKLTSVTKKQLQRIGAYRLNVEDFTEQTINDCLPEVELLGQFRRPQGSLIRQSDDVMFRMCCRDEEAHNVADKHWIEIDGDFYAVEDVIQKLTIAGYDVENDL